MKKQWVFKIALVLLLTGIIIPGYSYAEIIFEDNFDNQPDWYPQTKVEACKNTSCKNNVPGEWDFYMNQEAWHPSNPEYPDSHPTIQISNENFRGNSGKAFTRWLEANFGDGDGWGPVAHLQKDLGSNYNEIYVRFYIKFQPGFKWELYDYSLPGSAIKIFKVAHWDRIEGNPFSPTETGVLAPMLIFDLANSFDYGFRYLHAIRCDPQDCNYYCGGKYHDKLKFTGNPAFEQSLGDGNWHALEWHLKMNSNPGAADGVIEFWADGKLEYTRSDIEWMGAGSPGNLGWNTIDFGYNGYNSYLDNWSYKTTYNIGDTVIYNAQTWEAIQKNTNNKPDSNPQSWIKIADYSGGGEEYIAYDDVVVSTSYIGPDYVIGENKTGGSPVLNFSDIDSGPKTGNTDGLGSGAIVTIWGNYLGSSQGRSRVYVGDVEATAIYYWKDADGSLPGGPADLKTYHKMQEIAFAIPAGAADGPNTIKVTVAGVDSNTLPFTVRAGKIKFVKSTGNDSTGTGSWDNPYLTLSSVFEGGNGRVLAGDIVYSVGVCSTETGLCIGKKAQILGTAANPISLIAYPNTSVLFSTQAPNSNYGGVIFNFWGSNVDRASQYINLSKLSITARGNDSDSPNGVHVFKGNRLVGLEITGPTVYGGMGGAFTGGGGGNVGVGAGENGGGGKYYGIYMHNYGYQSAIPGKNNFGWVFNPDANTWTSANPIPYDGIGDSCTNCTTVDRFQHLYYISNRSRDAIDGYEIGWNYLTDNPILHGIHIYDQGSDLGGWNTPILIHHNVVRNQRGDSIDVYYPAAGVGPNIGTAAPVYIHDNLIINDAGNINNGRALLIRGAPLAKIYNNTIYGYRYINDVFSASSDYRNNLMVEVDLPLGYYKYYMCNAPTERGNNLFYGTHSTPMPSWFSSADGDLNEDPLFTNAASNDFSLQANSPAISAGSDATLVIAPRDFYGQPRLAGKVSIGAFEYVTTTSTAGDINADGEVNVLDVQICVNVVLGIETDADRVKKAKQAAEPLDSCDVLDIQTIVNIILNSV